MANTTNNKAVSTRDLYYYRRRLKNRTFARLASFFAEQAEKTGLTKKDLAVRLKKDPAQISRWLAGPSNLTLDTLSDLLLAMDAEADPPRMVRFVDRAKPNYAHPLMASIIGAGFLATNPSNVVSIDPQHSQQPVTTPSSGDISINVWHANTAAN